MIPEEHIRAIISGDRPEQIGVTWSSICRDACLSEEFIIEFEGKVSWAIISEFQQLSEEFVLDRIDDLYIDRLLKNKKIEMTPEIKMLLQLKTI